MHAAATTPSFKQLFDRLISAEGQGRPAKTVEVFGWLIMVEGSLTLFFPHLVVSLMQLAPLTPDAATYLRVAGVLIGGIGMLYVVSGRVNAEGFVFASLLDRPIVPVIMAVLWYTNVVSGTVALAFSVQDFGSFLWTLSEWKARERSVKPAFA
jgi:hypothetical protein